MRTHITTLCIAARYHVRSISKIRRYLDEESCDKVATRLSPRDLTWTETETEICSSEDAKISNIAAIAQ